jgi:hypothetical protein
VTERNKKLRTYYKKRNFNKKDIICQLVIDCQKLVDTGLLPKIDDLIYDIESGQLVIT